MAVSYAAIGVRTSGNAGTTTTAIARPTTANTAGNITLCGRTIKPESATGTAESGWTQQVSATGGTGVTGIDVGLTRIVVDYQELAGGETGSVTFDQGSTPNSVASCMITYSKTGTVWSIVSTSGDDATHGTGRSATGSAITMAAGDLIVAFVASDTDSATAYTSPAITATGMTITTTERLAAGGVTQNNDSGIAIYDGLITAGTEASVAPSISLSGGPSSCGPVAFVRLRELSPVLTQAAFRFFQDGTESGSTALASQDTNYTADTSSGDVNLGLRIRVQSTAGSNIPATDDFQLQYELNDSATWNDVVGTTAPAVADTYAETNQSAVLPLASTSSGRYQYGQSFLGDGKLLSQSSFWLQKSGSPPGDITSSLYAHTGTFGTSSGLPTGSALTTSSPVSATTLTTSFAWIDFAFDGSVTLTNGTPYFIVCSYTFTSTLHYLQYGSDDTAPTHAGIGTYMTAGGGVSLENSTLDHPFKIYTSLVGTTVIPYASANLTDGAATTNRLGAGSGSFTAGEVSEDGLVDDLGWSVNNYTEFLYSLTLKEADLVADDTLDFRVVRNGSTSGFTYTAVPRITIGAGVTDGTATPAVIARSLTVPVPIIPTSVSTSPAVVARTVTIDQATPGAGATLSPAVITRSFTVDAPTVKASSTVTASLIARIIDVPAATGSGVTSATALPAVTPLAAILPAPTPTAGSTSSPAVITRAVVLPASTPLASSTTSPAVIARTLALPAPTASAATQVSPAAIVRALALPAPTPTAGSTSSPAAATLVLTVPAVAATGGGAATAAPATVALALLEPVPTITAGGSTTPAVTALQALLGASTTFAGISGTASPAAIVRALLAPASTPTAGSQTAPAAIALAALLPVATGTGAAAGTAAPNVIARTILLGAPTPTAASTTNPAVIARTLTLGVPTLSTGSSTTPSALTFAVVLPAPTVASAAAGTATPGVIPLNLLEPAPTPTAGSKVMPAVMAFAIVELAPTVTGVANALPAAIARAFALPAPTPKASSTTTAATIALALQLGTPLPMVHDEATPGTIVRAFTLPAPAVHGAGTGLPATITLVLLLPTVGALGSIFPDLTPYIRAYILDGQRVYRLTGARGYILEGERVYRVKGDRTYEIDGRRIYRP